MQVRKKNATHIHHNVVIATVTNRKVRHKLRSHMAIHDCKLELHGVARDPSMQHVTTSHSMLYVFHSNLCESCKSVEVVT